MANKKTKSVNLEKALTDLESLVEKLEAEQVGLEDALKLFEDGVALIKDCQKILTNAEQRVEQLTSKNKTSATIDFELEE